MLSSRAKIEIAIAGIYASIISIVLIGCLIHPELFWDRLVWKYFWGPIEADAGFTTETTADYNWLDTMTYAITLALASYYIHRLFVKMDLRVGTGFFLALSPIILIGPLARALEDMEFFNRPLQYIFISPVIYIFLGILTLITILVAHRIENLGRGSDKASWLLLMAPGLAVSLIITAFPGWVEGTVSIIPILLITLASAYIHKKISRDLKWELLVGTLWAQILLFIVYFYIIWGTGGEWYRSYSDASGSPDTAFPGAVGIILLVLGTTIGTCILVKLLSRRWQSIGGILVPVNIMIIGGHMLDASATFVGLDFYGYTEKHVVPENLMMFADSAGFPYPGMVMFPLKLLFLLPALYYMDVKMREETKENPHLMALVKLIILVLGFAPGARDIIRIALGV